MFELMKDLRAMEDVNSCFPFGQEHHVTIKHGVDVKTIQQQLNHHRNLKVKSVEPTIEDCFMDLMRQKK
jgi:hypothetical protein